MKRLLIGTLLAFSTTGLLAQESAASLSELSELVRQGTLRDTQETRDRMRDFEAERDQQANLLANAQNERVAEEARSEELKAAFDANELLLADKTKQLEERLGSLKELFGHMTGFIGDARENIDGSIVSAQYPGRTDFMDDLVAKMSGTAELPEVEEMRRVWSETLDQIIESGKVVKFTADIEGESREVVRVGNYNLISNGEYLSYDPTTGNVSALGRQPPGLSSKASALQSASGGFTALGIDPTGPVGGGFLAALVELPDWGERLLTQGKEVGYVLMALLAAAIIIAIFKLIQMTIVGGKIRSQLKSSSANSNNPLGRILAVHEENAGVDTETLELKLNEAILKERPAIEAWINALKIIAAVGPLLGLLGTVTGMILTFQGIALYGAGDVQGMAGGISQALITTVWGLIVAIPTILLHTLVNSQAMRIIHTLDEQAAGIVAEKAEA